MAYIDNFLSRRHRITRDIVTLFQHTDKNLFLLPHLDYLQYELKASKKDMVGALVGMLAKSNSPESRIARLVLWQCRDPYVQESLEQLYRNCAASHSWYQPLKKLVERWCAPHWLQRLGAPAFDPADPALKDFEMHLAREGWEPEEVSEIWLEAADYFRPELRIMLLKNAAAHPSFQLTAVADMEILFHDPEVLSVLVGLLAECPESKAREQLEKLTESSSMPIRAEAQLALNRWKSREHSPTPLPPPPREVEAWIADNAMTGMHSILYITEEPKDNYKLMYFEVDTWDHGLCACWGLPCLEAQDVPLVRRYMEAAVCKEPLAPLEPAMARGWIRKGLELNYNRYKRTPLKWGVWQRQILLPTPYVVPPEVIFGRHCMVCRRPIKRELDRETRSLVLGPIAVCSLCLRKRNHCDCCGKKQAIRKMRAIARPEVSQIDFFCESCYEKQCSPPAALPEA